MGTCTPPAGGSLLQAVPSLQPPLLLPTAASCKPHLSLTDTVGNKAHLPAAVGSPPPQPRGTAGPSVLRGWKLGRVTEAPPSASRWHQAGAHACASHMGQAWPSQLHAPRPGWVAGQGPMQRVEEELPRDPAGPSARPPTVARLPHREPSLFSGTQK